MEIIGVILFAVISLLFNKLGNKQEQNPKQQRPIPQKPHLSIPKRLEDVAKELFDEFEEPERRTPIPVRPERTKRPVEPLPSDSVQKREVQLATPIEEHQRKGSSERYSALTKAIPRKDTKINESEPALFPRNNKEFLQAFIFSEVIGPPKSKR